MSGKQWAGRIVAVVQLACWCSVSGLLLNRGISNLTMEEQVVGRPARGFTAGVIMVSVSCIMLLLSPTFLLMKIIDMRRRRRILLQLAHNDVPPNYDDVVERAPRYSSLFLVSESGSVRLLNESGPAASIVPCRQNLEEAPRYSSLFRVTESGEILERNNDSNHKKNNKEQELEQNDEQEALQQSIEQEELQEQQQHHEQQENETVVIEN